MNLPIDLTKLRVFPLAERKSQTSIDEILVDPDASPPDCDAFNRGLIAQTAQQIVRARENGASVMLIYGAHLLRNGASLILNRMMERGWITHLATNGAGTIHDWEFSWLGRSSECVRHNVSTGTFGTWDETSRNIHLAILAGALHDEGYGRSLGRFIYEDGVTLPMADALEESIRREPAHRLTPARAELLQTMRVHGIAPGRQKVKHPWKHASIIGQAFKNDVAMSVHPGIGYDIISNHPIFNGAAIGRAATIDFCQFGAAVEKLDGGVVLSVGSAIMGPQVFEKSISCVNNLRIQAQRPIVKDHSICVVDIQDGGKWDWSQGEPPKTNPAYYLRFCKSYARMGGSMQYLQCDNIAFVHNLLHALQRL